MSNSTNHYNNIAKQNDHQMHKVNNVDNKVLNFKIRLTTPRYVNTNNKLEKISNEE